MDESKSGSIGDVSGRTMAFGIILGAAIGQSMDTLASGIAVGIVLGVAMSSASNRRESEE